MEHSLTFARHFARLVWLTLNEPASHEAQLATLRALVAASSQGRVTISTRDWHLVVNGELLPERFTGAQDLTAQLIGHSIIELIAEPGVSPIDLSVVARILAREPVPGDGGRTVVAMLESMRVESLRFTVEAPRELARKITLPTTSLGPGIPGMMSGSDTASLFLMNTGEPNPPAAAEQASGDDEDEGDLVKDSNPETLFESFSAVDESPVQSVAKLFAQLDSALARRNGSGMRQLDSLVKIASESAASGRDELAADVFVRLIEREREAADDRSTRRMYGMAIRRLTKPGVLHAVARLMPDNREMEEQHMSVIRRTEDAGVEALVDALVDAPSLADRRVYFDALIKLNSGARTLLFMLGDDRWYVVRNAVELLGEMRVAEADAELTRLLGHTDDRVRTAAAAALSKLGTSTAMKGLLHAAQASADPQGRDRATEALSPGLGRSVDAIARALEKEEDDRVQMAMLTALAQIGTTDAVDRLTRIARNEKGIFRKAKTPLRVAAVRALGDVQTPAATAALNSLARDKEKDIRGAASWILLGRRRQKQGPPPDDVA
jgi:HEAT repeat protein